MLFNRNFRAITEPNSFNSFARSSSKYLDKNTDTGSN